MSQNPAALDHGTRLRLHLIPLAATLFLAAYGKFVCPFIDSVEFPEVAGGLFIVSVIHLTMREALYRLRPPRQNGPHPARHYYLLSVWTWLTAGLMGVIVHETLHPNFPSASHLKLVAGYWTLGAGILAMIEYAALEQYFRKIEQVQPAVLTERMTRRLMEAFAVVTLVPIVTLTLTAIRFVDEGYASPLIVGEVVFLGIVFMATALFAAWRYGMSLRQDCDRLLCAVNEIQDGRYDFTIDTTRADELGRVATGINGMARGLALRERMRDAFGRFVDPTVAAKVIGDLSQPGKAVALGGRRHEVTVLIADLRGFTQLAESMPPEDLVEMLNGHFSALVEIIGAHGGMVDKFIGDAVLAVFGLDGTVDHSEQAVHAARDIAAAVERRNGEQSTAGRPPFRIGIGLHRGPVVAGLIGSQQRLEYTVIGATVNVAARLESEARPPHPPILMSAAVADALGPDAMVERLGPTSLKGVKDRVEIYALSAPAPA